MNIDKLFYKQKLLWLGIIFCFMAIVVVFINLVFSSKEPPAPSEWGEETEATEENSLADEENKSIFTQLNFQEAHQGFQDSYLDLIQKISQADTERIDMAKGAKLYKSYDYARDKYVDVKKRFDDYEKGFKLKCFNQMRRLIMAVLYHDRKKKKRMTKFDPELLIEMGAIEKMPVCPRGGTYSIVYKAGRRLFRCSVHGILKN